MQQKLCQVCGERGREYEFFMRPVGAFCDKHAPEIPCHWDFSEGQIEQMVLFAKAEELKRLKQKWTSPLRVVDE